MPYGWKICSVSDIAYLRTGATFDKANVLLSNKNEGIRVLRGGNISTYKIDFQIDDIFIPTAIVNPSIHVQQYDIITPAVTSLENIGKMARVFTKPTSNYTVGGFVYLLTPLFYNDTFSKFLLYQFTSTWFIRQLQAIAKKSGAAFYNINKTKFNGLPVFIPPLEEQARIVKRIEELFEQIEIIEQNQADIDTLYEEFRKRTLTLAIQGKLVPRDPNDEPASVLLERIRAEKKAKLGKKYVDSYIYKGDDNCYYEHIAARAQDEPVEVLFDIPENWAFTRLDTIIGLSSGTNLTSATMAKSEQIYPVFGGNGITGYYDKYNIGADHIIIGRVGFYCGSIHVTNKKSWITDNALIVSFDNSSISTSFFALLLESLELGKKSSATAQPLVTGKIIKPIIVALPPLAEQNRIVAKINEIFAML